MRLLQRLRNLFTDECSKTIQDQDRLIDSLKCDIRINVAEIERLNDVISSLTFEIKRLNNRR